MAGTSPSRRTLRSTPSALLRAEGALLRAASVAGMVREIARLIDDHMGENTVILDISEACSFTDYFIITTARSSAHLSGLARELSRFFIQNGIRPRGGNKRHAAKGWLLVDCGNFLIHLMEREQREFYGLERLWFRAPKLSYSSKSS